MSDKEKSNPEEANKVYEKNLEVYGARVHNLKNIDVIIP